MAISSEGGAGGKFRKKPFRRSPTKPYDRPHNAARGDSSRGWLSKIVDPASKLITLGANCLFDSVFRKRITANSHVLPLDQDLMRDTHDILPEADPLDSAVAQESENVQASGTSNVRESVIAELEQLLKQNSFTRYEIDRLTQLVRARTFDAPSNDKGETPEDNSPMLLAADMQRDHVVSTLNENGDRCLRGRASIPSTSRIPEDDMASPAELAKAYMGSRSTRLSPSALSFRPFHLKQEAPLVSTSAFHHKSAIAPDLEPKAPSLRPDINFISPRSRGRSAMNGCTPYSRSPFPNGHKSLKRRYSALDDDIGTIHPISRLAKKPNLLHSKVNGFPLPVSGNKHASIDTPQKQLENGSSDMGLMSVPSKSSQTAAKIFQHLETLASPKKDKLADAKGKSPMVLTENILNGKALKSHQDIGSPSKACRDLDVKTEDGPLFSPFDKKGDKTQGRELVVVEQNDKNFPAPGSSSADIFESKIPSSKDDLILPSVYPNYGKKKRGFVMSAEEDYPDTEDDTGDVNISSLPGKLPDSNEKANVTLESKHLTAENDKAVVSSINHGESITGDESSRKTEETSPTCLAVDKDNGFNLPTAMAMSATTGQMSLCAPTMPPVSKISSISSEEVVAPAPKFQSPSSDPASGLHVSSTIHSLPYPKIETSSRSEQKEPDVRNNSDEKSNQRVEMMKMPSVELSTVKSEMSSPLSAVFSFAGSNQNEKPPLFPSMFSSSTASSSVSSLVSASTSSPFATSGGGTISVPSTSTLPAFAFGCPTPISSTCPLLKTATLDSKDSHSSIKCNTGTEAEASAEPAMPVPPDSGAKSSFLPTTISVGSGLAAFSQSKPSLPSNIPQSFSPASVFGSIGTSMSVFNPGFTFGAVGGQSSASSTSTPAFTFGSSSSSPSGSTLFGSTTTTPAPSWPTSFSFGNTSASSSTLLSTSQSTPTAALAPSGSAFSFSSPSMAFSSAPSITSPGTGFLFSASAASSSHMSTATLFSPASPTFGNFSNTSGVNPFQSSGNADSMNADDTMAEDTAQPSGFTPPRFALGMGGPTPSQPSFPTFGQPAQPAQTPLFGSPLDTNAIAGSFSFGSAGVDKSNRKIVRVKHKPRRK